MSNELDYIIVLLDKINRLYNSILDDDFTKQDGIDLLKNRLRASDPRLKRFYRKFDQIESHLIEIQTEVEGI